MLDVDYFKKFNDCYGHLAGDECLRLVGTTLKTIVGERLTLLHDMVEKSLLLYCPRQTKMGLSLWGSVSGKQFEELVIPNSASDIAECVTVSPGDVTVYTNGLSSPVKVVALADEALYCAKKRGRNQIAVATATCC